jgi:hypothetical protein
MITMPVLAGAQPPVARIHAGDRVRVRTGTAATQVGWVQRLAADTIWLARCIGAPCTARPLVVRPDDAIEVNHMYAAVARARHRTIAMTTLGGFALGYLSAGGPGEEGYGYIPIAAVTLLGFLVGAGTAESLHPEQWEPASP